MKSYPTIQYFNQGLFGENIYAFNKIDGSNIRAQWNRKSGWYKFGTRNVMIDENDPIFGSAIPIFLNKYGDELERVFNQKKYRKIQSFLAFGEYFGESSFSGMHLSTDVMDVILFDVDQYKHGFVTPKNFIDDFGHLDIPELIYQGKYTMEFVNSVYKDAYKLSEGVVVKGIFKTRNNKDEVWQVKIKTLNWLLKVKELHGKNALLKELNGDKKLLNFFDKVQLGL